MSAANLIEQAAEAGVQFSLSDSGLKAVATRKPPDALIEALLANREAVKAELESAADQDAHVIDFVDWLERAAIIEFDGGLDRPTAERNATQIINFRRKEQHT